MRLSAAAAALSAVLLLTSCNIFDPFDSPGSDARIRSAARSCIDKGDFACALDWYSKLSTQTDQDRADQAFIQLDEAGVGMGEFMGAFGTGNNSSGVVLTRLANSIGAHADAANRQKIFQAFLKSRTISDPQTKALVQFLSSVAFVANMLGEEADVKGSLQPIDLSSSPSTCASDTIPVCTCPTPSSAAIQGGAAHNFDTDTTISDTPDYGMMRAAFLQINNSGSVMGIPSSSNALIALAIQSGGLSDACTRKILLDAQVGLK